jgi:arylsulfatase A-like enzyme
VRATRVLSGGACLAWAALLGGCGDGAAEVIGVETVWLVESSLIIPSAEYTILSETDASAVRVGQFGCTAVQREGGGPRPGVMMPVPAEVRLELPDGLTTGGRLLVQTGITRSTHKRKGRGEVLFEVLVGDELALSEVRSFGRGISEEERLWSDHELDLGAVESVTLRTSIVSGASTKVEAVFAALEVRVPTELPRTRASVDHPNIILLVIDTLRADRLEPYGYERATSPHLAAMAERGVVFEHTLAPSSWTSPSTATLLSGMDPLRHGFLDADTSFLAYEETTLAEVCRVAGLQTAAFIANPILTPGHNFQQGFDVYRELYRSPGIDLVAEARKWIEEQEGARFFLYLHLFDPHMPYAPAAQYSESFVSPAPSGFRAGITVEMMKDFYEGGDVDMAVLDRFIAHQSDQYDAEVAASDVAIGDLARALEELSIGDRTVVAVTSDHGEAFGEHGMLAHANSLYDEVLRVPLIFTGPGVAGGDRRSERVEIKDVGKTLLELAHVPGAQRMEGSSLLADGVPRSQPALLFASIWNGIYPVPGEDRIEHKRKIFRVESAEWMLIWIPRDEGEEDDRLELFAAGASAEDAVDLSAENPEVVIALRDAIAGWIEETYRDKRTLFSGEEALELLRELGYVGED